MSEQHEPPRPISSTIVELELTGCVTAFAGDQPVLLCMHGAPPEDRFVAVFSSKEKLEQLWRDYPDLPPYDRIKVVLNGPDFVESILDSGYRWLRLIFDPYRHPNGRLRFTEVFPRGN